MSLRMAVSDIDSAGRRLSFRWLSATATESDRTETCKPTICQSRRYGVLPSTAYVKRHPVGLDSPERLAAVMEAAERTK